MDLLSLLVGLMFLWLGAACASLALYHALFHDRPEPPAPDWLDIEPPPYAPDVIP